MKKIYRLFFKKISIFFGFYFSKFIEIFDYKIIPSYNDQKNFKLVYSDKTRRPIILLNNQIFPKLTIDTSGYTSELCKLGSKYQTNKSPMNFNGHRSGFTPFYDQIFNIHKDKKINFAEIGIEKNASIKMWRDYFSKAKIYGFEYEDIKIKKAREFKLKNTIYEKIDVTKSKSIKKALSKINQKFEIIIDDSTHYFDHQINVIKNVYPFLKKNGILIIEDIYRKKKIYSEKNYFNKLKNYKKYFKRIYFVEIFNLNNYTASWKNEKLLVLIRK